MRETNSAEEAEIRRFSELCAVIFGFMRWTWDKKIPTADEIEDNVTELVETHGGVSHRVSSGRTTVDFHSDVGADGVRFTLTLEV